MLLIGATLVLVLAACGSSPPTTTLGGQTVLVVRDAGPCGDEGSCPERIRVGNRHYVVTHVSVDEDALGPVHGTTVDGPISGIDRARTIAGVPAEDALGARRAHDGSWMVITAGRTTGEHRERFCAVVDEPAAFPECSTD